MWEVEKFIVDYPPYLFISVSFALFILYLCVKFAVRNRDKLALLLSSFVRKAKPYISILVGIYAFLERLVQENAEIFIEKVKRGAFAFVRGLIKLLFLLAFILVMSELLLRLTERFNPTLAFRIYEGRTFSKLRIAKSIFMSYPQRPWRFGLKPNISFYVPSFLHDRRFPIKTNSFGIREDEEVFSEERSAEGEGRQMEVAVFLGDSTIFGWGVSTPIDRIFEKETGIYSLNLGVPNFNTRLEWNYFADFVEKVSDSIRIKALFLGFSLNDLPQEDICFDEKTGIFVICEALEKIKSSFSQRRHLSNEIKGFLSMYRKLIFLSSPSQYFLARVRVISMLYDMTLPDGFRWGISIFYEMRRENEVLDIASSPWGTKKLDEWLRSTEEFILKFRDFCRRNDIFFSVLVFPTDRIFYEGGRNHRRNYDYLWDRLLRVFSDAGVNYIDFFSVVKEKAEREELPYYLLFTFDDFRFSDEGHSFFGKFVAEKFMEYHR